MELIKVDKNLCTRCKLCIEVCPSSVIDINKDGPYALNPDSCIACGQCTAVCPNKAIDNMKSPLSKQIPIKNFPVITSQTAEKFLRSRRSIRCYKETPVPKETLLKLVDIARFAPTASNTQGLSYIIVYDKKILEKATKIIVQWMESQLENPYHYSFPHHVKNYRENGNDTILRNAPHLILAIAPHDFKNGRENTISSLSYVELFATALGLGSCWAGLFEMCVFANYSPLLNLFNIPEGKVITGAIMVGYPKYKYKRLVDRNPISIYTI
ncbi:nitroreductase family protein [Clostridium tyrobutyricum]|uniref:nitroreductase family protein n=1 Tax=Clostridium tyrobutyricum TaxID=1519 RepID=UPI001C388D92|nr:nitroreductase family protein [Clostridium tyrobutyricum]MBV4418448.1 nitroreductase family protein [Clostridium tyrobutyricum]